MCPRGRAAAAPAPAAASGGAAAGRVVSAAGYEKTAGYDLTTRKRLWDVKGGEYTFFFLPDDQTFVSHEHDRVRLRSMATGLDVAPAFDLRPLGIGIHPRLLPDGKTLLIGTGEGLVLRFHIAR